MLWRGTFVRAVELIVPATDVAEAFFDQITTAPESRYPNFDVPSQRVVMSARRHDLRRQRLMRGGNSTGWPNRRVLAVEEFHQFRDHLVRRFFHEPVP